MQSPVHVIVAGVNSVEPDSIDTPGIDVPDTENIPVEPGGNDIPAENVPDTDDFPVEPDSIDISGINVPNTENNPVEPDSIDISGVNLPGTEDILVEPDGTDISEEVNVPNTENIPVPVEPNSIDISVVNVPNTEKIPVEPNRIDISEENVPNTDNISVDSKSVDTSEENVTNMDNIPIDLETSILQPLSSTAVKVLAGSHVPTIDIILNSAGIMSIREHTHSRGRIELYFATTHRSYFLFACLMTPQLLEPVYNIPIEPMLVKTDRWAFHERSTIVWADLRYGILSIDHDWSPIRRFGVFNTMARRESDEEYSPLDYSAEVQRACRLIANFMFVLARAIIYMLDLLVFVSISFLVVAGGTRFISFVQEFYWDINGEALYVSHFSTGNHELIVFRMRELLRHVYCFLKSKREHWPQVIWFFYIDHAAVGYNLGKCD